MNPLKVFLSIVILLERLHLRHSLPRCVHQTLPSAEVEMEGREALDAGLTTRMPQRGS